MAALKEIKKRINSIKSIRKTTSAMKMVSSAKLHKAESMIYNMLPYSEALRHVMESLLTGDYSGPLNRERPVMNVAIIAFSSDSSLCGAFNSNVSRELQKTIDKYKKSLSDEHIFIYTIGRKVYDNIRKTGITITKNFESMAGKADYNTIAAFAASLIAQFENNQIDRVELIYHHFKRAGSRELVKEPLLPVILPVSEKQGYQHGEYIYEPSREKLLGTLVPKSIKLQLYAALLDSNASEYAARMIAMQTATDNADDLVGELTIEFNKSRQQAITNELLDLAGGSL
ncbi:MAG: ATP synthase F1 subunit gamma [Tannerella sp.]|jgi:F-type H+-transporting ATPase subunit gamma|nr:ATP synthase F1 subunit gamma [Tannerella sp.]